MYSLILGKTVFLGNSKIRAFSPRNTDEVDPIVLFSAENSELAFAELRVSFRGDEIHRGLKLGIFQSLQSLSSAQAICMQVASAFNHPALPFTHVETPQTTDKEFRSQFAAGLERGRDSGICGKQAFVGTQPQSFGETFNNRMNSEDSMAARLAPRYQSLPSLSANGFSERLVIGWDSVDSSALPRTSLRVGRRISHFPQPDSGPFRRTSSQYFK